MMNLHENPEQLYKRLADEEHEVEDILQQSAKAKAVQQKLLAESANGLRMLSQVLD